MWQVWSIVWKGSHVEGGCCYFVCLQRAETGPVGESCQESGFRRLSLDLVVDKMLSWQDVFSLFLVMFTLELDAYLSWIWEQRFCFERKSRSKILSSLSTLWFYEPWQLFSFYLNSSDNKKDILVWSDIHICLQLNICMSTICPCLVLNNSKGETTALTG